MGNYRFQRSWSPQHHNPRATRFDSPALTADNMIDLDNNNNDDDDDDDDDNFIPDEFDEDSVAESEADIGLDEDKLKECSIFTIYNKTYKCDKTIFTPGDLEEMKMRENVMMERMERGFYWLKIDHKKLYLEIM